jgi:hypothetical protein
LNNLLNNQKQGKKEVNGFNFIIILAEEFVKGDYHGVNAIPYDKSENKLFFTGDIVEDWNNAVSYLEKNEVEIVCSSTLDNFLMDNDGDYSFDNNKFKIVRNK